MAQLVASMSTLIGPVPEMDDTGTVAGEAVLPWLQEMDGFRGMMILTDESQEKARVLTFWESRDHAERSLTTRHQLRDRMAAAVGMEIESTESYVVATLQLVDGA
jgi:heme-degrading monooxygenase HmoA